MSNNDYGYTEVEEYSPDPGTPQTGKKAYVAAAGTAVVTFIGLWVADTDPFTIKEAAQAAVTSVVSSGIIGLLTYQTKNRAL